MMDINQPQRDVQHTEPGLAGFDRLCWAVAGLVEEAGEVIGVHSKLSWKKNRKKLTEEAWADELGDVLWYLAQVALCKGLTLEEIWVKNQEKLTARFGPNQKNI